MIWSSLFLVSIIQALFLITLIAYRNAKNPVASGLIIVLLIIIIFTNLGYLSIRTDLRHYMPQLFGIPLGMILLFGPLLYFYSRSIIDNSFSWKKKYWLHFLPYLFQLGINMPLLLMSSSNWNWFINSFLAGNSLIRDTEKITFALQDLHLFFYLVLIFRLTRSAKSNNGNTHYIVPLSSRIKWLRGLSLWFLFLLITVISLYIFILFNGKYNPVTNYIYTLVTSGIIYFIAYKLVLNPEPISPDFAKKYKSYMQFEGEAGEIHIAKLRTLMDQDKIFTDPDLKLLSLAKEVGLPAHQVSKLINEKFGKSFNDYVNEYRVNEFISYLNHPKYQSFSIYGIAMEAGFNSKSSFNSSFKKITGKNPSDYKAGL